MKKVLQISHLPKNIIHTGGFIRQKKIKESLLENYIVETLSFSPGEKTEFLGYDFFVDKPSYESTDFIIEYLLSNHLRLLSKYSLYIKKFNPDIILLEQPFMYELYEFLIKTHALNKEHVLIYSSHNIESDLYKNKDERFLNKLQHLESAAIKNSIFQLCVSEEEKNIMKKGYLISNGNENFIGKENKEWKEIFNNGYKNLVFIGSDHFPNQNSIQYISTFLPNDVLIWVIGSSVNKINSHSNIRKIGEVDKKVMDDIIFESDGIILPIFEGGGTSLKTAQALLTNKPIIGTNFSFRGFEYYKNQPGVFLYDGKEEFKKIINNLPKKTMYNRTNLDDLKWDTILKKIPYIFELHKL